MSIDTIISSFTTPTGIILLAFQIVLTLIFVYITMTKSNRNALIANLVAAGFNTTMRIIMQDYLTAVICAFIGIRTLAYLYCHKIDIHITPWFFIISQAAISFALFANPIQILSLFASCWSCWYMWYWYRDVKLYKIGGIICNLSWFAYDVYSGLYIAAINGMFMVLCYASFLVKHRKEKLPPQIVRSPRTNDKLSDDDTYSQSEKAK